ncbi:hypothetical protein KL915_003588 [Ogataea haglerorum]|nr:hypothetical protein KL915_003588 [Ogataea haglerorum]
MLTSNGKKRATASANCGPWSWEKWPGGSPAAAQPVPFDPAAKACLWGQISALSLQDTSARAIRAHLYPRNAAFSIRCHIAMPRGILKNAPRDADYCADEPGTLSTDAAEFDRKKVIENTRLNSKLFRDSSSKGDLIRSKIQEQKERLQHEGNLEHLKWDEKNILINELEKSATMKIDEPKTPYEGGFDPNNDYYRSDNEEDEVEALDLGEGVDDGAQVYSEDRIEVVEQPEHKSESEPESDDENKELSPEEKHRLFEERRKQHYHLKANPLKQPIQVSDDEE